MIDRISVEASRRCGKGCAFCYNGSSRDGDGRWDDADLASFALDCARNGVGAISLGGGEPLEVPWIFRLLRALEGVMLRSLTTNGLPLLHEPMLDALVDARPDKIHVSIHAPENAREVERVTEQVRVLSDRGVRSGVNLLVRRSRLDDATRAMAHLVRSGIGVDRVVLLPMRGSDTPSAHELGRVAGVPRFQSMTCLSGCGKSPRFASIDADRRVAWCSYTRTRRLLTAPRYAALVAALDGLGLAPCDAGNLVRLDARS